MELNYTLSPQALAIVRAGSKAEILEALAERFGGAYRLDPALVLEALEEREKLGSTGFGRGVAIPHARIEGINRPVAALIRLESPVDFDAADDLAQEIFMRVHRARKRYRPEAKFTTWLYRVVVNAAHDVRRRQQTRARASQGWGDWELARQDEIAVQAEASDWLAQAMTQLSPELRDTVALVLGEEMTQAEAGVVLGVSEGTIAWRMSEVKKRLRAMAREDAK